MWSVPASPTLLLRHEKLGAHQNPTVEVGSEATSNEYLTVAQKRCRVGETGPSILVRRSKYPGHNKDARSRIEYLAIVQQPGLVLSARDEHFAAEKNGGGMSVS